MTLDQVFASKRTIEIGDRRYQVSPVKMREWGQFTAWLKDHGRSPIGALRTDELARLDDETRSEVVREAVAATKLWPPAILSQDWHYVVSDTTDGDATLVHTILSRDNPITIDQCRDLVETLTSRDWLTLICVARGVDPPPKLISPPGQSLNLNLAEGTSGEK